MVMVYCEGYTEWHVIRKLSGHGILSGHLIEPDESGKHVINSPKRITRKLIESRPTFWNKFLLVYDREDYPSPYDFVQNKFNHLGQWNQRGKNIFCIGIQSRIVYLHVNDAISPNGYGDFDGYIWNLINNLGVKAVDVLWNKLPTYIKQSLTGTRDNVHRIGSSEIQNLMQNNRFPIQRSKGNIYAYITALQIAKSHGWFSEKLVEQALGNGHTREVKNAFSSLIQAWDWLNKGVCS